MDAGQGRRAASSSSQQRFEDPSVLVDVTVVVTPTAMVDVLVVAEKQGSNASLSSSQHSDSVDAETLLDVELLLVVESPLAVKPLPSVESRLTAKTLLVVESLLTLAEVFAAGASEEDEDEELFPSVATDIEACSPAECVLLLLLSTSGDAVDDGITVTVTVEVKRTVSIADTGNSSLG